MSSLKARPVQVIGIDIGNSSIKVAAKQGKIKNNCINDDGDSLPATIVFSADGYNLCIPQTKQNCVKVDDVKLHIGERPSENDILVYCNQ